MRARESVSSSALYLRDGASEDRAPGADSHPDLGSSEGARERPRDLGLVCELGALESVS